MVQPAATILPFPWIATALAPTRAPEMPVSTLPSPSKVLAQERPAV